MWLSGDSTGFVNQRRIVQRGFESLHRLKINHLPGWWNGRHAGLKIQWAEMPVRVRVPLQVLNY